MRSFDDRIKGGDLDAARDVRCERIERNHTHAHGNADLGDTPGAEAATGYYFGDPALKREVEQILGEAREDGDERLEQLAERFLRRVVRGRA